MYSQTSAAPGCHKCKQTSVTKFLHKSASEFDLQYDYVVSLPVCRQLMSALAAVGPPNPREDPECCSILHGLVAAVESLCKITELQHERRTALMDTAERVANRGRIICLTNAKR